MCVCVFYWGLTVGVCVFCVFFCFFFFFVFSCLSICLLLLDNISLSSDKPFIMQVTPLEEKDKSGLSETRCILSLAKLAEMSRHK